MRVMKRRIKIFLRKTRIKHRVRARKITYKRIFLIKRRNSALNTLLTTKTLTVFSSRF